MKKYVVSLAIGCILFGIGCAVFAVEIYDYNYENTLPVNELAVKTITLDETLENKNYFVLSKSSKMDAIIDDTIEIGHVKIVISYYSSFTNLNKSYEEYSNYKLLMLDTNAKVNNFNQTKSFIDLVVAKLKAKEIYNYSLLFQPNIVVYINSANTDNVKVKNYN
ncbi:MAG: hypothetical protein PHQ89_00860 [Bacilli bacterium]|nr:hypothetical protein [Bacilli bacterium]